MPARGGVHRDGAVAGFDSNRGQVGQALLLGFLDIAEQGASGSDAQGFVFNAESGQIMQAEELQQLATAAVGIEQPWRAATDTVAFAHRRRPAIFVR